jgi:hypothetical protein
MKNLKELKIYNGVAHEINIIGDDERVIYDYTLRKNTCLFDESLIKHTIPVNNMVSCVTLDNQISDFIYNKEVIHVEELPENYDIYIVSAMYANAYKKIHGDNDKLYTVYNPVYSLDGKTIHGCMGICKAF